MFTRTGFIACISAALLFPPALTAAAETIPLEIASGHSVVLHVAALRRVGVGDGKIVGVAPLADSEVVVNGKAPGRTTVFLWTGSHRDTYEVTVTDQSLDDLARMLRRAIKVPGIEVATFDRSLMVNGTVATPEQNIELGQLIERFSKVAEASKYAVVDAVTVADPLGKMQAGVTAVPGVLGVNVERDGDGDLIVSGKVADKSSEENVLSEVTADAGSLLGQNGKVIDRLESVTTSQIDIKVYVLEVDRTAQSSLGLELQGATPASSGTTPIGGQNYNLGAPSFPLVENPGVSGVGKALNVGPFQRIGLLAPTLNLLLDEGHARVLSSPDLVALPGANATFLVGGQIPVPQSNGLGTVTVAYKDFGVKLNVTPTLLSNGSIETKIDPEISNLDFTDGVEVSGFLIPALKVSQISTDVITQSGESIVMGGLLSRMEQKNIQKIPLLGDIPILGQLFRSTSYQNSESDVVFVMTPQLLVR